MQEPTEGGLAPVLDRLIIDVAKAVTDVVAAAVAIVTWASICSVVVIAIWHGDNAYLLSHGRVIYWTATMIYTIATIVAVSTSLAGFIALYAMVEVFRRNAEKNMKLFVALPYAVIRAFLGPGLLTFAFLAVAMLTIPAATALGFIAR